MHYINIFRLFILEGFLSAFFKGFILSWAKCMEIKTVGELLHWSYANLAMAHSTITAKAEKYGRAQFMIRSRLYAGMNNHTMNICPLADDER